MKKFIVIFLALACLYSCNKEQIYYEVFFNVNTLNGIPITRVINDNDVITAIKEVYPTEYYIQLRNVENGNIYKMKTNEIRYVPNGEYLVTNYSPDDINGNFGVGELYGAKCKPKHSICINPGWGFCKYPKIVINETINITKSGEISLNGEFKCQAFVYDTDLVDCVKWDCGSDIYNIECFNAYKNFAFFFFWDRDCQAYYFKLKVVAKENVGIETTKYTINGSQNYGGLKYGCFYFLNCTEIINSEINNLVNVPNFVKGGNL